MTLQGYIYEVKKVFKQFKHSEEETDSYFNTDDAKNLLAKKYKDYTSDDAYISAGATPNAVASCLDMLY